MLLKPSLVPRSLRIISLAAGALFLPAAYFADLSTATNLLLLSLLGFIGDRWLHTRRVVAELKRDSTEAIHLTAELTYRVAEQEQVAEQLRRRVERFRKAFDDGAIGMAIVSLSSEILRINRSLAKLLGFSQSELKSTHFESLLPDYDTAPYRRELAKLFYGAAQSIQIEQRLMRNDGDTVWVTWTASMMPAAGEHSAQYIFQFQDISDRKRAERRLAFEAGHDALTGLPNRTLFLERLQAAFRHARHGLRGNFAVCHLDFDRFKLVNDSFGQEVGDMLLIEVAARLRSAVPSGGAIARLGGDEFAILIEDMQTVGEAVSASESIRKEMARPFDLEGNRVQSTVSIGIAPWQRHYERPEILLRDAATALSQAKRSGRDRCQIFSDDLRAAARSFLENETDLRAALERSELCLFYQPIVALTNGRLAGFEALVRWNHPERGLVSPSEFIPIAEETGLIFAIGEWTLRVACRQLAAWKTLYPEAAKLWVGVNVSAKQFMQADVERLVSETLVESGIDPEALKLELTESAMAENLEFVAEVMHRLKHLGVNLSIDDFGTGYSSLNNLHVLPLDSLKIDRSFVSNMRGSSENHQIVKTILSLANSLNLDVVAEGVETEEQSHQLVALGCQMGQGYYFSPPVEARFAEGLIKSLCLPTSDRPFSLPSTTYESLRPSA